MRRLGALAGLAIAACPRSTPPAGPGAPVTDAAVDAVAAAAPVPPPGLRLPDGVAPTGYQVALAIDPDEPRFTGEVAIELALARPTDVVWLHAHALAIDEATIAVGGEVAPVTVVPDDKAQRLGLALGRVAPAGPATLRLRYHGTIVDDDNLGLFRQRENGRWYVFTQMEGLFARRVVPCFDEPGWKTPWQVTVASPPGLAILGNQPEAARRQRPDGWTEVAFTPSPPMASYLLGVAVGPFELVDVGPVGRGAVPVRIVAPAGQRAFTDGAVRVVPPIVEALEAYFDRPLPVAKLDLVAVPVFFGAMENTGLITAAAPVLLQDPARPSFAAQRDQRVTIAHEIAHQWFGDLVTLAWWDDLWLNESFATWMAAKVQRQLDPHDDAIAAARDASDHAMEADARPSAQPLRRPIAGGEDVDQSFDAIAYQKGAALLAMFERRLGADRFRAGVRAYVAAHAGGSATAADFVAALAAASEAETAAAFASFLDHPGTPEVGLALDCTGPTPAAVAELRSARGAPPWTLPLCVRFPDRGATWGERCGWIPPAGGRIELPHCPAWVVGNADGAGYYRVHHAPPLAAALRANLQRVAVAERVAIASDLAALARTGAVELAELPAWIDAFLAAGDRHDVLAAVELAQLLGRFADGEVAAPWRRWITRRFAAQARRAGVVARPGETVAAASARRALGTLVGITGRDATIAKLARKRIDTWLAGGADPGDDRALLLGIAAASGDRALYDRVLAAAQATGDREIKRTLIATLGAFVDAESITRNRELYLARTFDPRDAVPLVTSGLGSARGEAAAWAELTAHHDAIANLLPPLERPALVAAAAARCSPGAYDQVATFFAPHADRDPRLALVLAQTLEAIDLCVADRTRHRDPAAAVIAATK